MIKGVNFSNLVNGRRREGLMKEINLKNAQKNVHHALISGHCDKEYGNSLPI
jgi:hypothetical protein